VGDHADVGAHLLAHVGDLVDERDLGGEEGVEAYLIISALAGSVRTTGESTSW